MVQCLPQLDSPMCGNVARCEDSDRSDLDEDNDAMLLGQPSGKRQRSLGRGLEQRRVRRREVIESLEEKTR